jgi:maleylacetoacetate isomerase
MPTLHGYFRSSASFRVRIALNLKGIAYQTVSHHLRHGEQRAREYLALNPQGFVPALAIDDTVLAQSMAIIEYLDETQPGAKLLPADALGRARVRTLSQVVACDIHPIDNLRVLRYLRTEMGQDEAAVQAWYNHWIAEGFAAFEDMLAHGGTGAFCHGDRPTMADICLVPQVINARNFKLDMTPYPTIRRIAEACLAEPAFTAALPERQPDAE